MWSPWGWHTLAVTCNSGNRLQSCDCHMYICLILYINISSKMHGKRISKSPKIFYQQTPKGRPQERWKELYWEPQFRCNNAGRSTFTVRVNQYNWTNGSPSDWYIFRIPEFCCTFKLRRMLKISYSDLPAFHNSVSMPPCIRHHSSFHKEDEHEIKEINQRIHLTTQSDVCFQ